MEDYSQTEDILNHDSFLTSIYFEDWKKSITHQNNSPYNTNTLAYPAINKNIIDLICKLSNEMNFQPEIEFACIDTVDYFFIEHFNDLSDKVEKLVSENDQLTPADVWCSINKLLRAQVMLRVISVLSIVAKFYDVNTNFDMKIMQNLLKTVNCPFDKTSIQKSEFRVFKTLKYRIRKSASYEATEFLLRLCNKSNMYISKTSIKILRLIYLQRRDIYFIYIYSNKGIMLLGASIIYTSAKIINVDKNNKKILLYDLSYASGSTAKEIKILSKDIFHDIFDDQTNIK